MEIDLEKEDNPNNINNQYIILNENPIGEGKFSQVYLVEDKSKKQFAGKVFIEKDSSFKNEITMLKTVSSLNNPYIINYIDSGEGPVKIGEEETDNQYIITEYASKGILFDYIINSKVGLEEIYAKVIFKKILLGVKAIHAAGICHLDLKIENIFMDQKYNPKIGDFGFATDIKGEKGSGLLNKYVGTEAYAAPEILNNIPYQGIKADIFSLGAILFILVTCKLGFRAARKNDSNYIYIIAQKEKNYWKKIIEAYRNYPIKPDIAGLSKELKQLFYRMVQYDPDNRPDTIDDILNSPWMKEINDLKGEDYKKLEEKTYKLFQNLEQKSSDSNETVEKDQSQKYYSDVNRGNSESEIKYFEENIKCKYILEDELKLKKYMKIVGNIKPADFMNSLANAINEKFGENVNINESENNLTFDAVFESEKMAVEENDEIQKEIMEELNKLGIKDINELEKVIEKNNCVIRVELFESVNGGYIVLFVKKGGEIEDYYLYLDEIKKIIKKL